MASYLITYKKKHGRDTKLVEMPSIPKLLNWISKHGASCSYVLIQLVHGRWENVTGGMVILGDCSECKVRQPVIGTNYCKNCGAKMDGDGDG